MLDTLCAGDIFFIKIVRIFTILGESMADIISIDKWRQLAEKGKL
jgi:hypothetical protein